MLSLGKKVILFDGGFGSEIDAIGLSMEDPMEINITHSDAIKKIHMSYSDADIMTTNTFGLNRIKYHGAYSLKELAEKAIENARVVPNKKLFFDLGPTGSLLKPIGLLTFDEAYEAYKEMVLISKDLVDGYICETFSDIYELKACILAVKENSSKPVFATMTFDKSSRTLTGSTPEIVANVLEGLGVDALGVNCSLGPKELKDVITRLLNATSLPIMIQPNRGLPRIVNGKTVYDLEVAEYDKYINEYLQMGVSIIGGCCGTNPLFIHTISKYKGQEVVQRTIEKKTIVTSATSFVTIDDVIICGERLNPTGKKKLKQALIDKNYDYLVHEAINQVEAGANLLDLNVGVPKIDEVATMVEACAKVQEYVDVPLQIDSSNVKAIELGCRYYNGIPLINSVNGDQEVMAKVFPIAKKYGAVVLGLAMNHNGVPRTATERFEIAKEIITTASKYGISKNKLMIDTLVLTASAEQELVKETLEGLRLVRQLGVKTALGVSNVSFGLPNRGLLNKTFLTMAMNSGLNMPIMNPLDTEMVSMIKAYNVLMNIDKDSKNYIESFQDEEIIQANKATKIIDLNQAILKGLKDDVAILVEKELESKQPMEIINDILIPALKTVGNDYDKNKIYLPQLIASAEAAKIGFGVISSKFPKATSYKATIVLGTVFGDVHDIGKNICKVVLESYGYQVIDLGKDTPIEAFIEADKKYQPFAIGLSALMTTTVVNMEQIIDALRLNKSKAKIFVGGAVLTETIAKEIKADYYTKDALELVKKLDELLK